MEDAAGSTASHDYAERLRRLEGSRWRQALNVQAPYRWNIRRLKLGRTLDVGCGLGRNLAHLDGNGVGVDHNAESVEIARSKGLIAYTVEEFHASDGTRLQASFDSMLLAHVVEHLSEADAQALLHDYLPLLRPGGRVCFITPQERGFATDATHVRFVDFDGLAALANSVGLSVSASIRFRSPASSARSSRTTNSYFSLTRRTDPFTVEPHALIVSRSIFDKGFTWESSDAFALVLVISRCSSRRPPVSAITFDRGGSPRRGDGQPVAGHSGPLSPARLLDSRSNLGGPTQGPNGTLHLQVTGRGGVPSTGVSAVVLNVTVTNTQASGFITVWGDEVQTDRLEPQLHRRSDRPQPGCHSGRCEQRRRGHASTAPPGNADLVADVSGLYLSSTPTDPGSFTSLTPARFSTREAMPADLLKARTARFTCMWPAKAACPRPGVSAVVLNVTVTNAQSAGFITV